MRLRVYERVQRVFEAHDNRNLNILDSGRCNSALRGNGKRFGYFADDGRTDLDDRGNCWPGDWLAVHAHREVSRSCRARARRRARSLLARNLPEMPARNISAPRRRGASFSANPGDRADWHGRGWGIYASARSTALTGNAPSRTMRHWPRWAYSRRSRTVEGMPGSSPPSSTRSAPERIDVGTS